MSWFKYLDSNVDLTLPSEFEYIQPSLRRRTIFNSAKGLYL